MPYSLQPCGLQPTWLLCPWGFSGKNAGVGCHCCLQGIFLTQGSNLHLCITGKFFTGSDSKESACNAGDLGSKWIWNVGEVCNFLISVSSQQIFEATDGPVLQPHMISSVGPVLQLSFLQKANENTSWRHDGGLTQKT